MTISTTTIKNSYSGNGSTSAFTYTFKITDDDDIQVIIRSSTGTETVKTKTTHYTVSGVGSAGGGTITFTTGNIPATTQTVILRRATPQTQELDLIENSDLPSDSLENSYDKLTSITQELQEQIDRSIKLSRTNTINSTEFTIGAADRAGKILGFDSNGELSIVVSELGSYRGNWSTATIYNQRDLVKDTSNNNVYYINTPHTSSGTQPLSSNANTAYYQLVVDAAAATTSATNAANSATAAASSATTAGSYVATIAASASAASTSATNAANSATSASGYLATVSTSATNAANSATASAASASAASTSASNASSSASAASTSASNAATSASNASTSATAAQAALSSVETLFDNFDDRFLGTKTSNPTLDNDGNALSVGAVYYNSVSQQVRFYNGSTWDAPSASAATSATSAAASASAASTSASNAASSSSIATTAASNAEAVYDSFDDRYLGAKSTAPSLDNDGNALLTGAIYWNTTSNSLFIWTGSAWNAAAFSASGAVTSFNTRSGAVTLSSNDVTSAIGFTPISSSSTDTLTNKTISGSSNTISNLNASNLSSGTVASARLSLIASDIPSLDAAKITTGTIASARLSLTSSDLPTVPTTKGGTGLTTIGTANQYLKVNSGATALEYGTVDLTSLSASNLSSGTIPDARFPATLPATSGTNLTSLNGSNISSGTISNSRLTGSGAITINGSSVSLGGSTTIDAGVFNETIVTPTASQTTFTTAYTVGYVQVFVNGIKLLNGVDFTATNGTSIVLTSGVLTTDRVEIVKFK